MWKWLDDMLRTNREKPGIYIHIYLSVCPSSVLFLLFFLFFFSFNEGLWNTINSSVQIYNNIYIYIYIIYIYILSIYIIYIYIIFYQFSKCKIKLAYVARNWQSSYSFAVFNKRPGTACGPKPPSSAVCWKLRRSLFHRFLSREKRVAVIARRLLLH